MTEPQACNVACCQLPSLQSWCDASLQEVGQEGGVPAEQGEHGRMTSYIDDAAARPGSHLLVVTS
jgi:hypothetical protein